MKNALISAGSGSNGVALITLTATASEVHAGDPLRSFSSTWLAPRRAAGEERDDYLRIALGPAGPSKLGASELARRWEQAQDLCASAAIKVLVPVGGPALRLATKLSGNAQKMIATTIREPDWWVMPLDSVKHGGRRALRSHLWNLCQAKFLRRAVELAAGRVALHVPPPKLLGATPEAVTALERMLQQGGDIGVDLETAGIDPRSSPISAFGLASSEQSISTPWHGYNSRFYGVQAGLGAGPLDTLVAQRVRELLFSSRARKIFHNGSFDLNVLRGHGLEVAGEWEDTILAHRVCFPDLYHNLQFCMAHFACVDPWKTRFEVWRKDAGEPKDDWAECEPTALRSYNADDAAAEPVLWPWLAGELDRRHRGWEQYNILKELSIFSADCQWHGVCIDAERVEELDNGIARRLAELQREWDSLTGSTPLRGKGSKEALRVLFFETLRAPVLIKTNKGEPSLSSAALLDYDAPTQPDDRLADVAFLKFRISKASKARDAFLTPLKGSTRVYPKMNFGGTKGTRANCSDPNLQQWSKPKETKRPRTGKDVKLAPPLRKIVRADLGLLMHEHDANALELRLVAYAANIPIWLEWMEKGIDMHIEHVEQMFGIRITKKNDPDNLREITKTLTYARFYNDKASVEMVLRALKPKMPSLTEGRLKEVFRLFDIARPEVRQWQLERQEAIKRDGYVETGMGGWRQYHDRKYPDLNQAYSFSIQSTGGAFMNQGMLRVAKRLDAARGSRILFQVHDSLVCQSRPEFVQEDMAIVVEEMERPITLWQHENVTIPFESKVGYNWADQMDFKAFATLHWSSPED